MRAPAIEEEDIMLMEKEKRREREVGTRQKDVITSIYPAAMSPSINVQLLESLNIYKWIFCYIAVLLLCD